MVDRHENAPLLSLAAHAASVALEDARTLESTLRLGDLVRVQARLDDGWYGAAPVWREALRVSRVPDGGWAVRLAGRNFRLADGVEDDGFGRRRVHPDDLARFRRDVLPRLRLRLRDGGGP